MGVPPVVFYIGMSRFALLYGPRGNDVVVSVTLAQGRCHFKAYLTGAAGN